MVNSLKLNIYIYNIQRKIGHKEMYFFS